MKALNEHKVNQLYQDLVWERCYKSHLQIEMRSLPGIELLRLGSHYWARMEDLDIHLGDAEGLCRLGNFRGNNLCQHQNVHSRRLIAACWIFMESAGSDFAIFDMRTKAISSYPRKINSLILGCPIAAHQEKAVVKANRIIQLFQGI